MIKTMDENVVYYKGFKLEHYWAHVGQFGREMRWCIHRYYDESFIELCEAKQYIDDNIDDK